MRNDPFQCLGNCPPHNALCMRTHVHDKAEVFAQSLASQFLIFCIRVRSVCLVRHSAAQSGSVHLPYVGVSGALKHLPMSVFQGAKSLPEFLGLETFYSCVGKCDHFFTHILPRSAAPYRAITLLGSGKDSIIFFLTQAYA